MVKEIEKIGSKITPKRIVAAIGVSAVFSLPAAYAAGGYMESDHRYELAANARSAGSLDQAQQWDAKAYELNEHADRVVAVMRGVSLSGAASVALVAAGLLGSAQYRRYNSPSSEQQAQSEAAAAPPQEPSPEDIYDALARNQARPLQPV